MMYNCLWLFSLGQKKEDVLLLLVFSMNKKMLCILIIEKLVRCIYIYEKK